MTTRRRRRVEDRERKAAEGMPCAQCGEPLVAHDPHWVLAFITPDAPAVVTVLGSMGCFVAWATDLAVHYLDHLAEANEEEVSS